MSQQKPKISTSFSYETLEETLDVKPKGSQMHIGIPKEIAFQENRIALTPDAVSVLVSNGHHVTIEHNAGISGIRITVKLAQRSCMTGLRYSRPPYW
jgi:alanine dehydrogenase